MTDQTQTPPGDEDIEDFKRSLAVIGTELSKMVQRLAPPEAREHFKSAHVEALKGLRSLIDRRIERLSTEPKKGTSIKVE